MYGERIAQICAQYGIAHERLSATGCARRTRRDRRAARCASGRFTHVAVVHHETTTGRLNDLAALRDVCARARRAVAGRWRQQLRRRGRSISTIRASPRWPRPPTSACTACPGVVVRDRAARGAGAGREPHVLSGPRPAGALQDERGTPFTPAVHAYYALVEALREFAEQGGRRARIDATRRWRSRCGRGWRRSASRARSGGTNRRWCCALTGCRGHDLRKLHDALKAEGFVIYAGRATCPRHCSESPPWARS